MQTSTKERIEKWDYLKFILIFLVVLGHIADYYVDKSTTLKIVFMVIYTFHMPLFIFLSGMFAKRSVNEKNYTKIFSFLILYFVIKMILCISNMFIMGQATFSLFVEGGVPWYALVIFIQSLLTIWLNKFRKKYVLIASIVLGCVLGLDNSITDFLALSRVIVYYPFFFLGYSLKQEDVVKWLGKKKVIIGSSVFLVAFVLGVTIGIDHVYWLRPLLTGRNSFHSLGEMRKYGPVLRLFYYLFVTAIGSAVIAVIPNKINYWVGKEMAAMGSRTLQIYALHYPIIKFFVYVIPLYDIIRRILPRYAVIYVFPLTLIIILICGLKCFTKIFNKIVYPKTVEDK